MVAGSKQTAIFQDITANGDTEAITALMSGAKNIFLLLEVSNYTDGSYVLELSHSPDMINYEVITTTAAQSADGFKYIRLTLSTFETFKLKVTSSGVTSGATIKASLVYTANRL